MYQSLGKPVAVAALCLSTLGLAACGESSSEKAAKNVCSATNEISAQIEKLKNVPLSSSFPSEVSSSVQAVDKSVTKIKEEEPKLDTARQEELNAANKALQTDLATITASVVSAAKSGNIETALKQAEPQIKAAFEQLGSAYKKAHEELKCSS
jgi:hypothetical protein